jgi:large subunit ribosomal protein L15
MQLNDLRPAEGSKKNRKRIGRGNSSGHGTTAGRGSKGQLSRSGGGKGAGFEGGQNPLAMRLPKLPGFTSRNHTLYTPVNVGRLNDAYAAGETVNAATLVEKGIIKQASQMVKVLGDGSIDKALTVAVDKVSASAQAKIEAAGGKVESPC